MFDLDTELLTLMASCTETRVILGAEGRLFNASSGYVCDINSLWFAYYIISNWKLDLQSIDCKDFIFLSCLIDVTVAN